MNTTFSEMIDRLTATTPEQEDYTGEDGLLYCGKCHKPKEAILRRTRPLSLAVTATRRVRLPESRPRGTGSRRETAKAP